MDNPHDFPTKVLIPREKIKERIQNLAKDIANDYREKKVVLVGVMRGSLIFMADLLRALWLEGLYDCEPDFIGISSYGAATQSSREPIMTKDLQMDISSRHVLIVEDIVDTGYTVKKALDLLEKRNPASLKTLSLLSKPSRREVEVPIDYLGFEIENKWVVGYGFDVDNKGRGDPDIVEKLV